MKHKLIGYGFALVVLAGLIGYAVTHPLTPYDTLPVTGPYTENAPYYQIAASYPTSPVIATKSGTTADTVALTSIRSFVLNTIKEFKKNGNFDNLSAEDITMMGFDKGRKQVLQITYAVAPAPRTVSYIFTVYEDTLGAHGNTNFKIFTFDTETGERLSLGDLFTSGSEYLAELSRLSRAKLPGVTGSVSDKSFIEAGTAPEEQNFAHFLFDKGDLVLLFPPYQVAPYAAGAITLRIPTSELKDILKAEYR